MIPFEEKTVEYKVFDEETKKSIKGMTNELTWKFMQDRYVVLKNLIPKDIINMTLDNWKTHEESSDSGIYREEKDITYKNPASSIGKSTAMYSAPWAIALHNWLHEELKRHIDIDLGITYAYSRKYERGAYLGSHLDRPSCEISATLCLDYKSDDGSPWPIWLRNDKNYIRADAETVRVESQALSQRERKKNGCKSLLLEPGDILLYQGPNIPHWRDYFLGEYSYHIFVHFYNRNSQMRKIENFYHNRPQGVAGNLKKGVLEYDGRLSKYSSSDERTREYENFSEEYAKLQQSKDGLEFLADCVNNYGKLEKINK
jgi:hypothetical protein